ncbi:MAG: LysM peptidoglycan-binding domain-containing protein [bacterium]
MRKQIKIIGLVAGVLLAMGCVAAPSVWALSAGGMSIAPAPSEKFPDRKGWFVYEEVEPGAVIEDVARVINLDSKPNTIAIEAVDAFMTTDGSFALVEEPKDNQDIGSWIELSKTEVTLPSNKEQLIPFKITVPADAEVGDHIGALAVYRSNKEVEKTIRAGGARVGISTRVGARIYLTVKGEITRQLALRGRAMYGRGQQLVFHLKMENLGNIRADIAMTAKIYGIWGLYDSKEKVPLGQIFPKKTSTIEAVWPGKARPIFGPYWASITIEDTFKGLNPASSALPPAQPIHTWAFVFFVPYTQVAILLILAFLAWFIIQARRWQQLVRLARMRVATHKIKRGDHLMDIAARYGVGWKLLAQLNNIKPPYDLHGIAVLYVPDARGQRRDISVVSLTTYLIKPFRHWLDKLSPYYVIVIQPGDTQKDVENFTGLKWTEIAKYNGLKPTIRLRAKQELKVPNRRRKL